jgi:hypothetical protein
MVLLLCLTSCGARPSLLYCCGGGGGGGDGRGTSYRIGAREKPSHPQTPSIAPIASPNLVPPGQVRTDVAEVLDVSLVEVGATVEIEWCPVC